MPWEFPNKARVHSKRFRVSSSRTSGREQKKGTTGEGEGERKEGHACPQTPRFWKTHSPTNAASDWCGAGSVDYLAIETTIKPGMLCLRKSQIWSHQNCGRRLQNALDWYLFESCLCEGLWDQNLQGIIGDRAVKTREGQFQYWEWRSADQTGKNGLFIGHNINVN